MIFKPELIKGIAKTSHPYGCRKEVLNQIEYCKNSKQFHGPKKC
ncbi:trans-2-enoyl-CoA reductase [Clostridium beijerinckii]|nr:trans-2-enoyl-CoA reductase [Clostridium beijerinckii]